MSAPDTLFLKILLVPVLIASVTLVGRRDGQRVGGWLGSFPIVAGPILFVLSFENGAEFGAAAAYSAFVAIVPAMIFYVVYARLAVRTSWWIAAAIGIVIWCLVAGLLWQWGLPMILAAISVVAALWWSARAMPELSADGRLDRQATASPHPLELPARMVTGALVTLITSELGKQGGASIGGFASLFPSIGLVVAAFNHSRSGPAAAIHFLRGMTRGMWSVGAFCVTLTLTLPKIGLAASFGLAVLVAVATHAISRPRA
jgi:uncharacterized membrane protein (GlpM family)